MKRFLCLLMCLTCLLLPAAHASEAETGRTTPSPAS